MEDTKSKQVVSASIITSNSDSALSEMQAGIIDYSTTDKDGNYSIVKKAQDAVAKGIEDTQLIGKMTGIAKPYSPFFLEKMARESTVIPQCIRAYKNNITGFGLSVRMKDESIEPTSEMQSEQKMHEDIISLLCLDMPVEDAFAKAIEHRERFGYGFLEVIENLNGEVVEIKPIEDPKYIWVMPRDDNYTEYSVFRNGKEIKTKKRFRRYQQKVSNTTIWFKELGDPRTLDMYTGLYGGEEGISIERQANALLHLKQGDDAYGLPRWEGPMLTVAGSRKAESLNYMYFEEGRHTPLMILINGGELSKESRTLLTDYMNGIKGEAGQHKFLLLETEPLQQDTGLEDTPKVSVEVKPLAEILQKDELFQDYLKNAREKIQSAFLLPDIYVGYSKDYNVATAAEATKKTEEQVFIPERSSLSWIINNVLLNKYNFKYTEAYFMGPDTENTEQQSRMFALAKDSLSINQQCREYYDTINEDYTDNPDPNCDIPVHILKLTANQLMPQNIEGTINQVEDIKKSYDIDESDELIPILKNIGRELRKMSNEQNS